MTQYNNGHGAALLRISLGFLLLAHGLLKVLVFTVAGTVGYFESIGLPAIVAYLIIFGEPAGGIALIFGIYSRLVALLTVPIFAGAVWAHAGNGWVFSNPNGGWEFPLLLVILSVVVFLQGGGSCAVGRLPIIDRFIPNALK